MSRWLGAAVAIHLAILAVLGQIVFRFSAARPSRVAIQAERVSYVDVKATPMQPEVSRDVASTSPTPSNAHIPLVSRDTGSRTVAALPVGDAIGGGVAAGIRPSTPDARIALTPLAPPRSTLERFDSAVSAGTRVYNDSVAIVESWRKPGDWTIKDKRGRRWGWDTVGLALGNIQIHKWVFEPWFKDQVLRVPTGTQPEWRDREQIRKDVVSAAVTSAIHAERKLAIARTRARGDSIRRFGDPRAPIPEFAAAPR